VYSRGTHPREEGALNDLLPLPQACREAAPGKGATAINLFVEPGGGFEAEEVALARGLGIVPVSLGPRILRAETAGLVGAAALFYHCGELEPRKETNER